LEVDYYYLLGVDEKATNKEIRMAYRRMAEIYHPDKLRELPEESRKEGEEIMRLLNEAKSILLDPERRRQYDMRIGAGLEFQEVTVIEGGPGGESGDGEYMIAIEKDTLVNKMSRVLDSMKVAFSRDREFQNKIAVAEEIFEAQVLEEGRSEEAEDVMILDEEEEGGEIDGELEMKLQFTVVKENEEGEKKKEKKFRILAVEGDDGDEVSDEDEVDVEWE